MSYEFIPMDNHMVNKILAVYNKRVKFENPDLPETINLAYAVHDTVTDIIVTKLDELLIAGDASIREERYIVLSYKGNFELAVTKDIETGLSCHIENTEEDHPIPDEIIDTACKLCAFYNDILCTSEYEKKIISEKIADCLSDMVSEALKNRTEERKRTLEFFKTLEGQRETDRRKDYSEYLFENNRPDLAELIKKQRLNAIPVISEEMSDDDIPVGASKSGGYPDLPPEIPYPLLGRYTVYTRDYIENYDESAMQLVAQINLSECSPFDRDSLLPDHGILYIFWSGIPFDFNEFSKITKTKFMFYDRNNSPFKIYYYDGDLSRLKRTVPDKPYYKKYFDKPLPSRRYTFSFSRYEYDADKFKKELGDLWIHGHMFRESDTKLLGFDGDGVNIHETQDNFINLFQFSYNKDDICNVNWNISRSDLLKRNFDKVRIYNYIK